jgi:hypothetical protein
MERPGPCSYDICTRNVFFPGYSSLNVMFHAKRSSPLYLGYHDCLLHSATLKYFMHVKVHQYHTGMRQPQPLLHDCNAGLFIQTGRSELVCFGRVSSSCSTSSIGRGIVKRHEHHLILKLCWKPIYVNKYK